MIFPPMQVRCPASTTYVSKYVIDQVTDAFRTDVLRAVEQIPGNVPRMRGLLTLLNEQARVLDCEWEGLAELSGGTLSVTGGQRIGFWTCPNCGTYNEIDLEQD